MAAHVGGAPRPWVPGRESELERLRAAIRELEDALRCLQAEREQEGLDFPRRVAALEEQFEKERTAFYQRVEPELVAFAVELAQKIVGDEIAGGREAAVSVLRHAMRRLRDRSELRVRVNPHDAAALKDARARLCAEWDVPGRMEIVEDRRVDRGGCIVESRHGALDARISSQFQRARELLEEAIGDEQDAAAGSDDGAPVEGDHAQRPGQE